VSQSSFPGPGPDGEEPLPGVPARDEDDWDGDAEMAAYIADLEAGRARIPEEWEVEGPAATISLGDAADVDPAQLAALLGPDGLGGEVFARDRTADAMRPGPLLAALTEQAAGDLGRLTDNQVLGAVSAARRLAARAQYLELTAIAEFSRRRAAQFEDDRARGVPPGQRDGEFPDAELGYELLVSSATARDTMDLAADLETRLPATRAALHAGLIDGYQARLIWRPTRCLSDADAARADELLAALAPGLRYDALARKAAAVAMKLNPEAFKRGKDQARRERQRVIAGREESGNAFLSGRELAIEDALASKTYIDALAVALRRGGLPGTLGQLRVLALTDLTQGRDPRDRLVGPPETGPAPAPDGQARPDADHGSPAAGGAPGSDGHGGTDTGADGRANADADTGARESTGGSTDAGDGTDAGNGPGDGDSDDDDASWDGCPDKTGWQHERRGAGEDDGHYDDPPAPPRPPAPFPALINLTVPAGTAYGWSTAPGEIGGWGLTDPDDTRRLLQAATAHPRTRLCATLLGPDGTAVAHACARGPHPWIPPPVTATSRDGPGALAEFLRGLNLTVTPIATGACDHRNAEDRYVPSRKLGHLIRARTATCPAPGCGAQAHHNDLDHTTAYPAGPTDECNLGPPCRRHHRVKQAPGWKLEQPEPGLMRWTTPSGRSYTTRPTIYET
jgi:Domain of unknown function (DUF222)